MNIQKQVIGQSNTKQKQVRKIPVTVTVNLSKKEWEAYTKALDKTSIQHYLTRVISNSVAEILYNNPQLLGEYVEWQNERLSKRA